MSEKLCPICGGKKIYSPSGEEERGWLCNRCGSEFFGTDMNNTFWQQRIAELTAELAALREQVRWILVSERLPEEEYIFSDWYKSLSEHIELFAAAFAKATNLNPREIKMVQKTTSDGMKIWFEPFPDGSEIEMYRSRAELAEKQLAALREQVRWIPVSERLPELQDPCLVIYRSIDAISAIGLRYRQDVLDGYVWIDEDGLASPAGNVTHWMPPLPTPPEESENE